MLLEKLMMYLPAILFCLVCLIGFKIYFNRKINNKYVPMNEVNALQESLDNIQTQYGNLVEKILQKDEQIAGLKAQLEANRGSEEEDILIKYKQLKQENELLKSELESATGSAKIVKIR